MLKIVIFQQVYLQEPFLLAAELAEHEVIFLLFHNEYHKFIFYIEKQQVSLHNIRFKVLKLTKKIKSKLAKNFKRSEGWGK